MKPEALKSLYRSPGYQKNQLILDPYKIIQRVMWGIITTLHL
jgi:hypothetical protein